VGGGGCCDQFARGSIMEGRTAGTDATNSCNVLGNEKADGEITRGPLGRVELETSQTTSELSKPVPQLGLHPKKRPSQLMRA
jgi:hypothetical protein